MGEEHFLLVTPVKASVLLRQLILTEFI